MRVGVLKTKDADLWITKGTVFVAFLHDEISYEGALEYRDAIERLTGGQTANILIYGARVKVMPSGKVKEFFEAEAQWLRVRSMAVVNDSRVSVGVGNLFLSVFKGRRPIKLFLSEDSARKWLRGFAAQDDETVPRQGFQRTHATSAFSIAFDLEENYAKVSYAPRTKVDVDLAREIVAQFMEEFSGTPERPALLVDNVNVVGMTAEARSVFASAAPRRTAIITSNDFARLRGNLFILLGRPKYPTRCFTNEAAARDWLLQRFDAYRVDDSKAASSDLKKSLPLINALERFAARDFAPVDLELYRDDEMLQYFASALNILGEELGATLLKYQKLNEELEERVRQRTEEVQEQKDRQAQQARMAAVGRFAAGVAHEINNPLAIISLTCDSLRKKFDQGGSLLREDLNAGLLRIEKMTGRTAKIIRSMRALSRDASHDSSAVERVEEIISETLAVVETTLGDANIQLRSVIPTDGFSVLCRKGEICQVLVNLINNARDAVEPLSNDQRWVAVEASFDGKSMMILDVSNGGPPIPEEVRARLMEPFFTTKPAGRGTGLGLHVSRAIVESHGGRLQLVDKNGFTCFRVELQGAA